MSQKFKMSKNANYRINISLHVLILFTFLTVLFFTYISKLEIESITNVLNSAINDHVGIALSKINNSPNVSDYINWDQLNKMAKDIQITAKDESVAVVANHRRLLIIGIVIIILLSLILIIIYVYYYNKDADINIKKILLENIIVFSFIGAIEFLFFTKIASKYIPVTPDMLTDTILERVKFKLFEYLN